MKNFDIIHHISCDCFINTINLKVKALNKHSLIEIKKFYDKNQDIIDSFYGNENFKTFDIATKGTKFNYKKAKIVDMIGFTLGDHIDKDAKTTKKEG